MRKVRNVNFLDFATINSIYKKYFKTEFGGKNTNLLYQFVLLLINDFLKIFHSNFLEIHCLEDNKKIIGVMSWHMVSKHVVADYGICILPEERGKGLAKILMQESYEILKKKRINHVYILRRDPFPMIKKPKPKIVNIFYYQNVKFNELETNRKSSLKLSEYDFSCFPMVQKMIKKANNDSVFIPLFFKPPKSSVALTLKKTHSLIAFSRVWRYCIRKGKKIIGYAEMHYEPLIREMRIYLLLEGKADNLMNEFNKIFHMKNIPVSNLNVHAFFKPIGKEKMDKEVYEIKRLFELKRDL